MYPINDKIRKDFHYINLFNAFTIVINAANRFKSSDGISDFARISKLGTLCGETKRTDFLKRFLEKNLDIDRNALAMGWEDLAHYSLEHNNSISAEKFYRKSREIVPSRIFPRWSTIWDLFLKTGQYKKIIREHDRYNLSWWPSIKPNHAIFAWAYHKLGQEAKADSILNEIAKVAPESGDALVVKAAIAHDKGKTGEMEKLLQLARNHQNPRYVDDQFQRLTKKQK